MTGSDSTGTDDYWSWSSLREIDEASGVDKGTAFRAFKRLLPFLVEGSDFVVLDRRSHDGLAARWQAAGRLYRSSVNPVLLRPPVAEQLSTELQATIRR
jgi:hypothetical protein